MPCKVRSRRLRGSSLQCYTLCDIDGGVEVWAHELLAYIDTG
jgi:hypothetical protein